MPRLRYRLKALDPLDNPGVQTRVIGLEDGQMKALNDGQHDVKLSRIQLAAEVAQDPVAVFQDWKRPEHEDGLCYVGRPSHDFRGVEIETPPPPNMVFLVYTKPSGKITDWRWEKADPNNPDFPEDYQTRFGRLVWPKTQ